MMNKNIHKLRVGKKYNRNRKLTDKQREEIRFKYKNFPYSTRQLAAEYNVSRRLIQFILDPQKAKRAKKQLAERQAEGRYYDKEKHKEYMQRHREHKKNLYKKGLIQ